MKSLITALCGAFALAPYNAAFATDTQLGYIYPADQGVTVGLNPSGSTVFGYNERSGEESQYTWIFDVATQATSQFTCDILENCAPEGQVMWLTDANIAVGTYRDSQWATTVLNGLGETEANYPLNTACIWRDGARIALDHNRWEDPSTFVGQDGSLPRPNNGFYAMRMTEDTSTILGYLKAFTYMLPVRWTLNDDGTYTSTMLQRQTGQFFYQWVGASADCKRLVMNTSQSGGKSYIWDGDDAPWVFTYTEAGSTILEPRLIALSPSGNLAIMSCTRDGQQAYGVYNFATADLTWIAVPEGSASTNWFAANVVTDRGDGFICDYKYQLHYFNTELGINIPFTSYIEAYGDGIAKEGFAIPSKALVRMVSDDGRTICGNDLSASLEYAGWIVRLPETSPMLFALHNCEFISTSPNTALLKWTDPQLPQGTTIASYIIELDGGPGIEVDAVKADDGFTRAYIDCGTGSHTARLYAVARDANGKEWESVRQDLTITLSEQTDLYFFEDLCDSRIDETVMAYIYMHDTFQSVPATDSSVLNFRLDGGDFCNLTPFWYTCGFSQAEWHTYLESRWFDATESSEAFYFTWHERNMTINDEWLLGADNLLKVEYTTDGEHWIALHQSDGLSNGANWAVHVIDLSMLVGEQFRLRFHAYGAGNHACEWRVDYYGIMPHSAMYEAPQGLMVTEANEQGNKLAWKNNRGEYEVSYNYNSPMTYNNNLGNAGMPFYTACDYGPEKLKAFEGKYITAVATMLYEPESVEQEQHTKVQAVIFDQEGNEVSRGTLADDAPWYEAMVSTSMPIHHIVLDTPVLIEPDKTYRVSILITDYEPEMCPIWYFSASNNYIPGVTDLYSDDNLKSWNTVSDLFITAPDDEYDLYARCIFNIRPCITDSPQTSTEPYCQEQWFYQVYRDGELLPGGIAYFTQQSAVDPIGGDASYTVRSFRRNGCVSHMSEPLVYSANGITKPQIDGPTIPTLVRDGDTLHILGDYDSVEVYNLLGAKVTTARVIDLTGLQPDVYVIVLTKGGHTSTVKCVF